MKPKPPARHSARERPAPPHGFNGDGAAPERADRGPPADPAAAAPRELTEEEGLKLLLKQFQELREYVSYYASARTDSLTHLLRNVSRRMVWSALGFVALGGFMVIACWLVLSGIAQGASAWFGGQPWIGTLVTGVLALAGVGVGLLGAAALRTLASRRRTVRKYETRNARQRARFGRDVRD